jgi:hypothetical protein
MSLGFLPGAERPQVATLPGPWVPRSRIDSILSGLEFSDHDYLQSSIRTGIEAQGSDRSQRIDPPTFASAAICFTRLPCCSLGLYLGFP